MNEKNKRSILVSEICPACDYFGYCEQRTDCKALQVLVEIYEDLRRYDPSN